MTNSANKTFPQQKAFFAFLMLLATVILVSAASPVIQSWSGLLILALATLLLLATVVVLWIVLSFRLQSQQLTNLHLYRMQLLKKLNIIQTENGALLDREGNPLATRYPKKNKNSSS